MSSPGLVKRAPAVDAKMRLGMVFSTDFKKPRRMWRRYLVEDMAFFRLGFCGSGGRKAAGRKTYLPLFPRFAFFAAFHKNSATDFLREDHGTRRPINDLRITGPIRFRRLFGRSMEKKITIAVVAIVAIAGILLYRQYQSTSEGGNKPPRCWPTPGDHGVLRTR